jgi:hypothetical protein
MRQDPYQRHWHDVWLGRMPGTSPTRLTIDGIRWVPPEGYVQQASRRDQAKAQVDIATGGNVLTHQQVAAWAEACQKRWTHGAALIHASALLGTRSGETRVLTASRDVADAGWGNYVALDRGEVLIRHQAGTGNGPKLGLPKNSKIRDIIIPHCASRIQHLGLAPQPR